mgnify:CR=1 FL=1
MTTAKRTNYFTGYRKKNKRIDLWFPIEFYHQVEELSKKFDRKKTDFIRDCLRVIAGWSFLLLFPKEFALLIQHLTRIGTNVNQIATRVNVTGRLHVLELELLRTEVPEAVELVKNTLSDLQWLLPLIRWRLKIDPGFRKELINLLKETG